MIRKPPQTRISFKYSALWLYRMVTARQRRQIAAQLRSDGKMPIAVLFYHCVTDRSNNGWTMKSRDFCRQLDWLQANFDVVSLNEAQRRIRLERNDRPTVAITFDDGYADNMYTAIPELVQRGLTATYFVSTNYMKTGSRFPHDVMDNNCLQPNTLEHLREISNAKLEVGAHTRTHCDIGKVTDATQLHQEIVGSKQDLEDYLGTEVRYFSFPYGLPHNTSQSSVDLIMASKFEGFVTAYGAWNWPNSPGIHIRRIHADPGLQRIKNWLSLDQKKFHEPRVPFSEVCAAFS